MIIYPGAECNVIPAPGFCQAGQRRLYWSYSVDTGDCAQITGCYSEADMNVFPTIEACQQACEQAPENPPPIFPTQPTDNVRPPSVDMGT